jgi:hypothetical protein
MVRQVRVAGLAGILLAATAVTACAQNPAPVASAPAADCCTPCVRTVCCKEWVPETYQCSRTVYRTETRQETCTAYRCECVPETRTRTCTVYKTVPEVRAITKNVCVCVPVVEERTVMQTCVSYKTETVMKRRCVDHGHYECCEVPCGPTFRERLHKLCHRHKGCCDECEPCCVRTKTVRKWVSCPTWEEYPTTCCRRVCESKPVTCKVCTYRREVRQESCQVTCYKCVPETRTENYTCYVRRSVPYQTTRTVCVCVPHQESYTATRMVCRTVTKQVPVETCCASSPCGSSCCEATCCSHRHHHRERSHRCGGGHSFHHHKSCCD